MLKKIIIYHYINWKIVMILSILFTSVNLYAAENGRIKSVNCNTSDFSLKRGKSYLTIKTNKTLRAGDKIVVKRNRRHGKSCQVKLLSCNGKTVTCSKGKCGKNSPYIIPKCKIKPKPDGTIAAIFAKAMKWASSWRTREPTVTLSVRGTKPHVPMLMQKSISKLFTGINKLHVTWLSGDKPYKVLVKKKTSNGKFGFLVGSAKNVRSNSTTIKFKRPLKQSTYQLIIIDKHGEEGKFKFKIAGNLPKSVRNMHNKIKTSKDSRAIKQCKLSSTLLGKNWNPTIYFQAYQYIAKVNNKCASKLRKILEKSASPP